MIVVKVKKKGFTLSLENTFLETPLWLKTVSFYEIKSCVIVLSFYIKIR